MKIKCKECNGEGAYEYACWEQSKMVNCECSECDGNGYIEEDIEEYEEDDDDEPFVETLCSQIKDKFVTDTEAVFIDDRPAGSMIFAFSPRDQRTYHITYFISRGDVEKESTPLLGGLTLTAECISHAITQFMNTSGVAESEIKYIVEL